MLKTLTRLAIALALTTSLAVASAEEGDLVGVSGECYSEGYESGGQAQIAVSEDGEASHDGIVNEDDPTDLEGGAVAAVANAAEGAPDFLTGESDTLCTGPEEEETGRIDYVEAHALGFQVCYNGEVHVATDPEDWACGTRPIGPPDS